MGESAPAECRSSDGGLRMVKMIHSKLVGGSAMALCLYDRGGSNVYGVESEGRVVMTGTKAEAKQFYGRGW